MARNKTVLIPHSLILGGKAVPNAAICLYGLLADAHENGVDNPSINSLCKGAIKNRATVQKYLKWLEENGYITRTKNPGYPDDIVLIGYPKEGSDNYEERDRKD